MSNRFETVNEITFDLHAVANMHTIDELKNTEAAAHLGAEAEETYQTAWNKAQHFKPKQHEVKPVAVEKKKAE